MSLSKEKSDDIGSKYTGKVVMGMNTPGPDEMTIQELEGKRQLLWDDSINEEYLERVKAKAKEKAKEIMMFAELEAEAIRASARHEGYEQGLQEAQASVQAHQERVSAEVENILTQIGAQGATIFEERRQDIIALIKLAVEKTLAIEMKESRIQSVEALLIEALDRIESQRQITIKSSLADAPELETFIKGIQEKNPRLKYWTIKADLTMADGGILLESADGKVDNSVASRWEGVQPIFEQLADQITRPEED